MLELNDEHTKIVLNPPSALIDGERVEGGNDLIEAFNPALGEVISRVPSTTDADVKRAVNAARTTFDSNVWTKIPGRTKASILWRVAELIDVRASSLARLETLNNGMPLASAKRLVKLGAETFRYYAGWCTKIHGKTADVSAPAGEFHAFTRREPVGVAALIVPWNSPFVFACNKLATALAAGCSVVLKPAEETPLSTLALGEILREAGVPPGVANIVTGRGETVGATLVSDPDIDKVAFTGSTEVGKIIFREGANNIKRLTLELGGKSPVIVFDDADIDAAIAGIAIGIFSNAGQVCMAGSRVYIQSGVFERVVYGVAERAKNLRLGNGLDADSVMGPLISEKQLDRVNSLVQSGIKQNATVITGGCPVAGNGYFFQPTVLTTPDPGARIMREEIFGPVVTLIPFDDEDRVVRDANDTEYGLAAAIWTRDLARAHRLANKIRAGTIWLNCQLVTDRMMPFGGYRQSGLGREGGGEGLDAYLETKTVFLSLKS